MKKVLVLGINGFTGKYFQKYIQENNLQRKYIFIGVDKKNDKKIRIKCISADLLIPGSLENIIIAVKPDYIINFAGILKSDDPFRAIEINANLSLRIYETIVNNRISVDKILLIGSSAEYGEPKYLPVDEKHMLNPVNYNGLSKAIQTQYAKFYFCVYGLKVNVARTFNLMGRGMPENMAIGSFNKQIESAKDGDKIYVGNLNTKRDYIDIADAIDIYWKILIKGKPGEVYNVCSGKAQTMGKIIKSLIETSGKSLKISVDKRKTVKSEVKVIYGDNSKIKQIKAF